MIHTLQGDISISVTTAGGALTSIKAADGTEYLWQGDPAYWSGQAPLLFPIVGCLHGGRAILPDGSVCEMARHGLVRRMEFALKEKSARSVTLTVTANESTRRQYPYDFTADVTYALHGNRIDVTFTAFNASDSPMPCQFGGHPAFRCPNEEGLRFEDYYVEFEQPETASVPLLNSDGIIEVANRRPVLKNSQTLPLDHALFAQDALVFDHIRSRRVRLKSDKTRRCVTLDFKGMDYLGIWSAANDAPFVALEPWGGISSCTDEGDRFTGKRGVRIVPPQGSTTYTFSITIL